MNDHLPPPATGPFSAEPVIFVTDMNAACDFYVVKLGFAVAFMYGDLPFYGQVQRAGARLNLRRVNAPARPAVFRLALPLTLTLSP
jgi:catechol 2,3-dioxygenase-like lactoylglutathione lyase family enzyme